jgi:hypothetical protein
MTRHRASTSLLFAAAASRSSVFVRLARHSVRELL